MALEVSNISKRFGKKTALNGVSFTIEHGEIVGLIGPNGSGKTTLLNILMGMIKPTGGAFQVKDNAKVGMAVSRNGFFDDMTVLKNVMVQAELLEVKEVDVLKVMDYFSIDFSEMRFGKLSAGMKQRVALVMPFIRNNDLIYLDEPSNHLDIDSILTLRSKILHQKELGTAFLIASHILSDLEKICDRIVFLRAGELVGNSLTHELMQKYGNLEEAYLNIFNGMQI